MKETALLVVIGTVLPISGCATPATYAECMAGKTKGSGTTSSDLRVAESLCRERFPYPTPFPPTAREIAAAKRREEVAAQREIFDRCIEGYITKPYEGHGVSMEAYASQP